MKVVIPAAGYATRLYPLTKDKPKHLLEVRGKPIIEHVIDKTLELDVDEILIVTNAKFYPVFGKWADNYECRIPVRIFNDGTTSNEDRLGQIGDIQFVIDEAEVDDDLIILAGDNLFDFSLRRVYDFFAEKGEPVNAVYDVKTLHNARQLGVVSLDAEHKIVEFAEKPEHPKSTLASIGIYLLPKKKLKLMKKYLSHGLSPDKMGYFMEWMLEHDTIYGYPYEGKWFDIGYPEALEQAQEEFEA